MLFEPIMRGSTTVGVLSVGWDRRVASVDQPTTQVVILLAIEAAVAIERADLLAGLSRMAETDELTGLRIAARGTRRFDERSATRVGRTGPCVWPSSTSTTSRRSTTSTAT